METTRTKSQEELLREMTRIAAINHKLVKKALGKEEKKEDSNPYVQYARGSR
jgi:hypothetical protein